MKERVMSFFTKLLMYGSMWLIAIFPIQILIAAIYRVEYVYPDADKISSLTSSFWGVILIPPIFRFLAGVLKALLGDIWIDIENEFGLITYALTNKEPTRTFRARLWGIVSFLFVVSCIGIEIWWLITSFLTHDRAQFAGTTIWAIITIAFMKQVQKPDEAD